MSGFKNKHNFDNACKEIIEHKDSTDSNIKWATNIRKTVSRTGYVTQRQGTCIGTMHKRIVCGGVYKDHNWW